MGEWNQYHGQARQGIVEIDGLTRILSVATAQIFLARGWLQRRNQYLIYAVSVHIYHLEAQVLPLELVTHRWDPTQLRHE